MLGKFNFTVKYCAAIKRTRWVRLFELFNGSAMDAKCLTSVSNVLYIYKAFVELRNMNLLEHELGAFNFRSHRAVMFQTTVR